jgi:tetratricopeptide (TPR) repeat protein
MNRVNKFLGSIGILLFAGLLATGCSKASRSARHLSTADRYYEAGDYDGAEIEYLNALRLDGKSVVALSRLGIMSFEDHNFAKSIPFLLRVKALDPNNLEARSKLGSIYLIGRKPKEAREEASFILSKQPTHPDALLLLAESTVRTNLVETQQLLEKLRPQAGNKPEFHLALGMVAQRQQKFQDMEVAIKQAVALDPRSSAAQFALGNLFWAQTNVAQAEPALKAAAELAPWRSNRRIRFAEFKAQNGARAEAKRLVEDITKKAPDFLPAWNYLAQMAFDDGRTNDCASLLQTLLTRDSRNFEALTLNARLKLAQGEAVKAIAELEKLNSWYPGVAQVQYQLGLAHLLNKDSSKAIASLKNAIEIDPTAEKPLLLLAELQLGRGDSASAISALEAFLRLAPDHRGAQFLLGRAYGMQGKLENALAVYRGMLKSGATNVEVSYMTAVTLRQQSKNAEARALFEKVLQVKPDHLMALNQVIELDLQEKKADVALQRIQAEVTRNPKVAELTFLLARVCAARKETNQMESALLKTIELAPKTRLPYLLLARFYVESKRQPSALEKLDQALANNPKDTAALMLKGMIYDQAKDYVKAKDTYEILLKANPDDGHALNNLAYLYSEKLDKLDKAQELAQKAHKSRPEDPAVADTLGWILYKRSSYAEALPLLVQSATALSSEPEVQFHLGMTCYMLGQTEPARAALNRALQSGLDFAGKPEAERRLALLTGDLKSLDVKAVAELEKEASARPQDPITSVRLAAVYEQQGAWDKAKSTYEKALSANPNSATVLIKLASLYAERLNNPQRALELARNARKTAPDDPQVAHALGRIAFLTGDHKWALSLLQESARKTSGAADLQHDLAWAYFSLGKISNAENCMRSALQGIPALTNTASAQRFVSLCSLSTNLGRVKESAGQVQEILKAEPDYGPALMVAGIFYQNRGDLSAARLTWEKLLARYPLFAPANKYLAAIYAANPTENQKAYDFALKAREAFPDDSEVAKTLGIITCQRKDYSRAAQLLKESRRKQANDGELCYYLGTAHVALKENLEAKEALQKALQLNVDPKLATEARKLLAELK